MNLFANQNGPGIAEIAVDQAMNECPKTTDTEMDIHQQNIVDSVLSSLMDARHSTLEKLNELDSTRKSIEASIEGFSLGSVLESAKQKIVHLHARWHEILNNAKKEERAVYRNYQLFIHQNKLTREAVYPDSSVFHWSIIFAAVLAESAVNSFFFAGASEIGLLGGLFQALLISLLNIGSALLIGSLVLPFKNHVDTRKQLWGRTGTGIYIVFIFMFNLAVAHYRTLIEESPLIAGAETIPHLIREPLGINFEACNLLFLGMLFVIVALIKGYRSDDVYPGFGAIHRRYKESSNHHCSRLEAMKEIKQVIDEGSRETDALARNARQHIRKYKDSIFESEEAVAKFSKYLESAESACNNALWQYREANMRVRSSKEPAYFSERHSFGEHLIEIDLKKEKVSCGKIEARLREIEGKEKQKLYDGLREINEKAIEELTGYFEIMDKDTSSITKWNEKKEG